jgi:methylmalonyl-CoA mutase N-terminal domain/subunit
MLNPFRRKVRLDRLLQHVGAETARQEALDRLADAKARRDTRAIRAATDAVRDATHELLCMELRR